MARPLKVGADYFPLDVDLDVKIDFIERKYANDGFAVIVKLWQKIYKENGYYCKWDSDTAELFAFRNANNISTERLNGIIDLALKKELFNKEIFEKYGVLTSAGIQKRYLLVTVKRSRIDLDKRYLLIDVPKNAVNVYINGVKVSDNLKKVNNNTQSKVKESKENESTVNESKVNESSFENIDYIISYFKTQTGNKPGIYAKDSLKRYIDAGMSVEAICSIIDENVGNSRKTWGDVERKLLEEYSNLIT